VIYTSENENGCITELIIPIQVEGPPTAILTGKDIIVCGEDSTYIVQIAYVMGGVAPWTITITDDRDTFRLDTIVNSIYDFPVNVVIKLPKNTSGVPEYTEYVISNVVDSLGSSKQTNYGKVRIGVNPTPIIDTIANQYQTVCAGNATLPISFDGVATHYRWSIDKNIGVVNYSDKVIPSFMAINNTTDSIKATILITPEYWYNGVVCIGKTDTARIVVYPTPTVSHVKDTVVCHGLPIQITPTGSAKKFLFTTYQNIGMPDSVEVVKGSALTFTSNNTTLAPIVATIYVTPINETSTGTCNGETQSFTITVNPLPNLIPVEDMAYCAGTLVPSYQFTGLTSGANYRWKHVNGDTITSLPLQGIDFLPAFTANNLTNIALVAKYEVSAIYSYQGVTCSSIKDTFEVKVYNVPKVNPLQDLEVCAMSEVGPIVFQGSANTVFDWEKISGLDIGSTTSGTNTIPVFTAVNNNSYMRSATYQVTPRIENTACATGTPRTFTIYVNPAARLSSSIYNDELCSGERFEYEATSTSANVQFSWTRPVVAGINNGVANSNQGNVIREVLINNTDASITVPYYISLLFETCTHVDTIYVPVQPAQSIAFESSEYTVCEGSAAVEITYTLAQGAISTSYRLEFDANANAQGLLSMTSYQTLSSPTSLIINMPSSIVPGRYFAYLYLESNGCTTSTPYTFVINVLESSRITKQPESLVVMCLVNSSLHLEVGATGTNTTYQWYLNGNAIADATNAVYELESPTVDDFGDYYVVVGGNCGEETSITVHVIESFIQIEMMWDNVLYVSNKDLNLVGLEFAYYQWYRWSEAAGDFIQIFRNSDGQYYREPTAIDGTYMVQIFYKDSTSFYSCPVTYTKSTATKVPSMIYPNPIGISESFFVRIGNDIVSDVNYNKITIEVTNVIGDVVGRYVPTGETTELRIRLTSGVYTVKVRDNMGKILLTSKLVVK
jgi:hypothetical protein